MCIDKLISGINKAIQRWDSLRAKDEWLYSFRAPDQYLPYTELAIDNSISGCLYAIKLYLNPYKDSILLPQDLLNDLKYFTKLLQHSQEIIEHFSLLKDELNNISTQEVREQVYLICQKSIRSKVKEIIFNTEKLSDHDLRTKLFKYISKIQNFGVKTDETIVTDLETEPCISSVSAEPRPQPTSATFTNPFKTENTASEPISSSPSHTAKQTNSYRCGCSCHCLSYVFSWFCSVEKEPAGVQNDEAPNISTVKPI